MRKTVNCEACPAGVLLRTTLAATLAASYFNPPHPGARSKLLPTIPEGALFENGHICLC